MCTDAARKYIRKNDCGRISSGVTRGYICPVCFLKHSLQLIQIFFGRFEEGVIRVTSANRIRKHPNRQNVFQDYKVIKN